MTTSQCAFALSSQPARTLRAIIVQIKCDASSAQCLKRHNSAMQLLVSERVERYIVMQN